MLDGGECAKLQRHVVFVHMSEDGPLAAAARPQWPGMREALSANMDLCKKVVGYILRTLTDI